MEDAAKGIIEIRIVRAAADDWKRVRPQPTRLSWYVRCDASNGRSAAASGGGNTAAMRKCARRARCG